MYPGPFLIVPNLSSVLLMLVYWRVEEPCESDWHTLVLRVLCSCAAGLHRHLMQVVLALVFWVAEEPRVHAKSYHCGTGACAAAHALAGFINHS